MTLRIGHTRGKHYLEKLSKVSIRVIKNLECTTSSAHEAYNLGHYVGNYFVKI
jgi:hypothetical protein